MIMSRRRLLLVWGIFVTITIFLCLYLPLTARNARVNNDDDFIPFPTQIDHSTRHTTSIPLTNAKVKIKIPITSVSRSKTMIVQPTISSTKKPFCQPSKEDQVGVVYINKSVPQMQEVIERLSVDHGGFVRTGGTFKPEGCIVKNKLAIVIPYRNRSEHLRIFLRHMHPIMQRQMHEYRIIVVEQAGNYSFNRATLINIGFLEALKISNFECFVFHDVDHILENDKNDYGCPESPKLLGVSVDRFHRRWPYKKYFGGVGAFSKEQFEKINGYSNLYWGWGGEDDDAYNRIRAAGYSLTRSPTQFGRYIMLREHHVRAKAGGNRNELLRTSTQRMYTDGLNSVKYKVLKITEFPLYTHILAKLAEELDVPLNITTTKRPG